MIELVISNNLVKFYFDDLFAVLLAVWAIASTISSIVKIKYYICKRRLEKLRNNLNK